ncbi:MAG: pilus assembly protein N-terminal domain-containing protein, partial [Candidatus Omnitrophica bacterium]|nr:pilus assembly protein N-terminal domain-containing protein [Candidatus Omnitrophota bacterium]
MWGLPGSTPAQERHSTQARRSTEPLVVADLTTGSGTEVGKSAVSAEHQPASSPAHGEAAPIPPAIFMEPGAIQSLAVDGLTRVAIGDPKVVDVTVVSASELLLQAKAVGVTTLLLWDRRGQLTSAVEVIDRTPEAVTAQLRQVLNELNFSDIQVTREGDKIFLGGQVPTKEDLDRLKEILAAYEGMVTNLVTTPPVPPAPFVAPQSVKLTVQLVEMTRDGTEKLGVDWADKLTFTETTFGVLGPSGVSQVARLGEAFRLGALSRTGLNPVLNMLVSKGKARILAEPKLVAASGKEASTFLGVEVPIITATSFGTTTSSVSASIEFR